ncbi:MAG TPA: ABC transporter permease [Patescibacteria group bacterium]|nr:ABC transporter permease [Patescibacteria group bacterium]
MFDLKEAINDWKRSLRKLESFEDGAIAELESHLLDEFDKQRQNGLAEEEAFSAAIKKIGRPEDVGGEYFKESRRSLLASPSWQKSRFSPALLLNYLKVAWRRIVRQRGYSFINIFGLALGLACCLLITLLVLDELSFDRFHRNKADLFRVEGDMNVSDRSCRVVATPAPLAPALESEVPEIAAASRCVSAGEVLLQSGGRAFYEGEAFAVDPSFLRMFTFPLRRGDSRTALSGPDSIVISGELAEKFFPGLDPLGQVLRIDEQLDLRISGVLEKVPHNSSLRFQALLPFSFMKATNRGSDNWGDGTVQTYVQLRSGASPAVVSGKITGFIRARRSEDRTTLDLRPLTGIHLHAYSGYETGNTHLLFIILLSVIALIVLLIACINFMNLSTARSASRALEVGMRKVVGAGRGQLVRQFYLEAFLLCLLALGAGLLLASLVLPLFNSLTQRELGFGVAGFPTFLAVLVAVTVLTGLAAGSYPALLLSSFQPAKVLKGERTRGGGEKLRRLLVVLQFTLSIFLVICTLTVSHQLRYLQNKELGYDTRNLLTVPLRLEALRVFPVLKAEWLRIPNVQAVGGCRELPLFIGSFMNSPQWPGKDPQMKPLVGTTRIDAGFVAAMGIAMKEGSPGTEDEVETSPGSARFLVNEELAALINQKPILGTPFSGWDRKGTIAGVMKNFHFQSLEVRVEPLAFIVEAADLRQMVVRLGSGDAGRTVAAMKRAWQRLLPGIPFEQDFYAARIEKIYRGPEILGTVIAVFAAFTVIIACLGLFGLASFIAQARTKEIGVRKALGASAAEIVSLLTRDFLRPVLLANLVAWPLAFLAMNGLLRNFAYHASISPWAFPASGLLALAVAAATVGLQSSRAARANPVDSLRYE